MSNWKVPFNNLAPLTALVRKDLQKAFDRVLDASYFILGPELEAFEHEFSVFCGLPYVVGVASGTDSLTLSLMALLEPKSTVLTVANSAPAGVVAIKRAGMRVRFADVDEFGYIDSKKAIRLLEGVKAVVPVHLYGSTVRLDLLAEACMKQEVYVVEDACQAHGSFSEFYHQGDFSSTVCYSFYPTKNLGAYGDGGAIATRNRGLADRLRSLRNYGMKEGILPQYGMNSRLDELQAALLRAKIPYLKTINSFRRDLALLYYEKLRDLPYARMKKPNEGDNGHLVSLFCEDRAHLKTYLQSKGIQTGIHYPTPAYKQLAELEYHPSLPQTERICSEQLSLPAWYEMPLSMVDTVCKEIWRFYGR